MKSLHFLKAFLRKHLFEALFFVIGVIFTVIVSKIADKVYPNDTLNDKDTITVLYSINIPNIHDSLPPEDNVIQELKGKIEKLEIIKDYQNDIEARLKGVHSKQQQLVKVENEEFVAINDFVLNIKDYFPKYKGYISAGQSSFLAIDCPDVYNNQKYIDIYFDINNQNIFNKISIIAVELENNVNDSLGSHRYQLEENYFTPRFGKNHLRLINQIVKGDYKLYCGFLFKEDSSKEYPRYYKIVCNYHM